MLPPTMPAMVTVSIDVNASADRGMACVAALADLCGELGLAATWSVVGPADDQFGRIIGQIRPRQEIALLAGAWGDRQASRQLFGGELLRSLTRARHAGHQVSTLVLNEGQTEQHLDVLAKHGITAVCAADRCAGRIGPVGLLSAQGWFTPVSEDSARRPRSLRWGLWLMPPAVDALGAGARAVRRSIDRGVAADGYLRLAVDVLALAQAGRHGPRQIADVLAHVVAGQQRGVLRVQPVASVVAVLGRHRIATPAKSILRHTVA